VLLRRAAGAAALAAAGAALPLAAAADADLAAGERVFRSQCMGCHAIEEGRNRAGPTLHGLFGREAGTLEGFDYSDAMREAGIVWSEETLDAFLEDPRGMVPGTIMVFWGLHADDRRRVIAYLKSAAAE
jgi:cytochrome c